MEHILHEALNILKKGQKYAFATIVEASLKGTPRKAGAKMLVREDGTIIGTIGGGRYEKETIKECLKAMKKGQPKLVTYEYFGKKGQSVCGGLIKVFIEPVLEKRRLIICGAGHIGLPLSFLGKMLNWEVSIIDNRKSLANKRRFPHVDHICVGDYVKKLKGIKIDKNSLIMIVTQGHEFDFACLSEALKTPAAYIGCIASRTKKLKFFKALQKKGIKPIKLKRISIPAGIDIGAQAPEEIAISIAAEMVSHMNKEFVGTAKFKDKMSPVHIYELYQNERSNR